MRRGNASALKTFAVAELQEEAYLSVTSQKRCFCPDALMPMRHDIELATLEHKIGMDKTDEGASQGDERAQERTVRECFAEHCGDDGACREAEQKRCMRLDLAAQPMVFGMSDV